MLLYDFKDVYPGASIGILRIIRRTIRCNCLWRAHLVTLVNNSGSDTLSAMR